METFTGMKCGGALIGLIGSGFLSVPTDKSSIFVCNPFEFPTLFSNSKLWKKRDNGNFDEYITTGKSQFISRKKN